MVWFPVDGLLVWLSLVLVYALVPLVVGWLVPRFTVPFGLRLFGLRWLCLFLVSWFMVRFWFPLGSWFCVMGWVGFRFGLFSFLRLVWLVSDRLPFFGSAFGYGLVLVWFGCWFWLVRSGFPFLRWLSSLFWFWFVGLFFWFHLLFWFTVLVVGSFGFGSGYWLVCSLTGFVPLRWFRSLVRLFPSLPHACFRCCGSVGLRFL